MKYSRSLTRVVIFRPDPSKGGSRAGQIRLQGVPFFKELLLQTGRLQQQNKMHSNDLEAFGKKYCYFWFHSEVKFLTRFRRLSGLCHFGIFECNFYRFLSALILCNFHVYKWENAYSKDLNA